MNTFSKALTALKHPQGIKYTYLYLTSCNYCGYTEAKMYQYVHSQSINNTNSIVKLTSNCCIACF